MSRSSDLSMFRRAAAVVALLMTSLAMLLSVAPIAAHAADATKDSDCATKPADVPDGYACTVIYEPNGSSNGSYGEVWFLRGTDNVLRLLAYPTGQNVDPDVLLCARTSGPYTPSNTNQSDKCLGNTDSLVYSGTLSQLETAGQSLDAVAPLSQTVYWVLHLNQDERTTVALATLAAAPTASFNDSCDLGAIVVTLSNTAGTSPAHFTLTYGGADHTVDVPAGASTTQQVPVTEDTTGTVTVNAPGLPNAPVTHSWARNCTDNGSTQSGGTAAPTASLEHSCAIGGISVSLGNVAGTAPADFTLHYDGADHAEQVAAGASKTVTVPVAEDTTSTVTVSATGLTPQSDTFARNCSVTVPAQEHAVNPQVTFANACVSGITATLSNMDLNDSTVDAVTFTITTPGGSVEQVVVGPNQITKRSFDVADGTTGTLSVEAPGLAKQSTSYAKSCTAVLGEKLVNGGVTTTKAPKTDVAGEKATKLPMTGSATGQLLRASFLLLLVGSALALAGRRPYRPRHAR